MINNTSNNDSRTSNKLNSRCVDKDGMLRYISLNIFHTISYPKQLLEILTYRYPHIIGNTAKNINLVLR